MIVRTSVRILLVLVVLLAGYAAGRMSAGDPVQAQSTATRVFEMRTYTAPDAEKFAMLQARFRDHTTKMFAKHGMTSVGYWTPVDTPNTLVYILAYPSMEDAKKSWAGFRSDPDWQAVAEKTKQAGLTGVKIESKYLQPTDYSPLK
jgi:hypothetical protein